MLGINPVVIAHCLNVNPQYKPVKYKGRAFNTECYEVVKAKVDKLLKVDFIRRVNYSTWLSNVVLVKKASRQ